MSAASFSALDHPSFPAWLREGLDALFTAIPGLDRVTFSLWAVAGYDSDPHTEFCGAPEFHYEPHAERPSEDDLDRIPQVRMLERRTRELWHYVPLTFSWDDGATTLNGECEFHAERAGTITFRYQLMTGLGHEFHLGAAWSGGAWTAFDRITLQDYDGSDSDLLARDAIGALSSVSADDLELGTMPMPKGVEVDEDGRPTFDFPAGEITRCMEIR